MKKDSGLRKKAKMSSLKNLKKSMLEDMNEGLDSKMKEKVTVASDSKEGLEKGLDKAQEILKKRKEFKDGGCGDKYEDGGMRVKDLGEGDAYDRGYQEPMSRKKPEYIDSRKKKRTYKK